MKITGLEGQPAPDGNWYWVRKSNAREKEISQDHRHYYETILNEMWELYKKKNHDYGNSFSVLFQKFGLQSVVIRLWDKLLRLETLCERQAKVQDESIVDTLMDLVNYGILALAEMKKNDGM